MVYVWHRRSLNRPTREPMFSPFHAYSIAHKMRFVKGVLRKKFEIFEKVFEWSGAVKYLMMNRCPRKIYYIEELMI